MPHFTKVLERAAITIEITATQASPALGALGHGERDGVDIGQAGKRRHGIEAVGRKVLLHDLEREQNHGEQGRELHRRDQAERVLDLEMSLYLAAFD